jgi:arylformamidase
MGEAYIDIGIPLDERILVYPGDPQPRIEFSRSDGWTVGEYHGGLHAGTHLDAPWHAIPSGKRLHELDLGTFVGPCFVADLQRLDRRVRADDLEAAGMPAGARRLLIKTRNSGREYWREAWDENAIGIDVGAAAWCAARGLCLVGIDYLSVEPAGESAAHRKLFENGIAILEGLRLGHVSAGEYELIAAPVNLIGTDAAWCRALLRTR